MQHQLVLQFRRSSTADHGYVAGLEAGLALTLGDSVEMDGHDVGPKTINMFILTPDPTSAFRRSKPVLEGLGLLDKVTAAHRVVGGSSFRVIWPLRVRGRFKVS